MRPNTGAMSQRWPLAPVYTGTWRPHLHGRARHPPLLAELLRLQVAHQSRLHGLHRVCQPVNAVCGMGHSAHHALYRMCC